MMRCDVVWVCMEEKYLHYIQHSEKGLKQAV